MLIECQHLGYQFFQTNRSLQMLIKEATTIKPLLLIDLQIYKFST